MSVLDDVFVLVTAPEVVAVVVLGLEDWFEDVVDEGSLALAEVLALSGLTIGAGGGVSALVGAPGTGALALKVGGCCGRSEKYLSAVLIVYQLNLNSGTMSGSPVRSQ